MQRGTSKWWATRAEKRVAAAYGAIHSRSSGAWIVAKGDSKQPLSGSCLPAMMIESKHTGSYRKPAASASVKLSHFEKLRDEALAENRDPLLHLSLYAPDSPLSDREGNVDLVVRLLEDDVLREDRVRELEEPASFLTA